MKCDNCGAPLRLVAGRDYFCCDYCVTFHYPADTDESADGVKPLGEQAATNCPVCHAGLGVGSVEGRHVDYCAKCQGVFVSNDDFAGIVNARRARHTGPPDRPVPIDPEQLKRVLRCPACGKRMDAHPYYGPGNVVIDSCGACRMVWLDRGEIATIEAAPGER